MTQSHRGGSHIIRILLLVALIGIASPASAQAHDGWATHIALGGYLTAAFADVSQTAYCLGAHTCREANPHARYAMKRWGTVPTLTLKGAINTSIAVYLLHDYAKHTKRAFWLAIVAASVQSMAVSHNARVARR